ncbi:MAG: N-acetylglucosamine-6-phosphate deacetylase [Gammaproteobacteria bacterium]|nr:N-acetylglucosamine-6-phosphate deacetylase [Gammaproteobacteria bacterium]
MGDSSDRQWLHNGRLFDGEQVHEGAALLIGEGQVLEVGGATSKPANAEAVDLKGHLVAPGFVDIQVNGGGGVLFNDNPSIGTLQQMAAVHRKFGTTSFLPTLISDTAAVIESGIKAVSSAIEKGMTEIAGIHIEGPHLDPEYCGVHDAEKIRPLDKDAFELLTAMQRGITLVTLAPERVAPDTLARLSDSGVIVFAGHSGASYEETAAALASGLRGFTHLFNAMSPLTSRAPGMVGAALESTGSYAGLIADGYHVHPATLRLAVRSKGEQRILLVTDAMPSVGADNKQFTLYGEDIRAEGGRCLTADGRLAGSDIGMIEAVRNMVSFGCADIYTALRMASLNPASAIGLDSQLGRIGAGKRADLIELDADLNIVRTWVAGQMKEH